MSDDSWAMEYIRSASEAPLLGRDDEDDLASRASAGDAVALHDLAASSRRVVIAIAKRDAERPPDQSLADVLRAGDRGMRLAIDRFDRAKGFHFRHVAVWWVRRAIDEQLGRERPPATE